MSRACAQGEVSRELLSQAHAGSRWHWALLRKGMVKPLCEKAAVQRHQPIRGCLRERGTRLDKRHQTTVRAGPHSPVLTCQVAWKFSKGRAAALGGVTAVAATAAITSSRRCHTPEQNSTHSQQPWQPQFFFFFFFSVLYAASYLGIPAKVLAKVLAKICSGAIRR